MSRIDHSKAVEFALAYENLEEVRNQMRHLRDQYEAAKARFHDARLELFPQSLPGAVRVTPEVNGIDMSKGT